MERPAEMSAVESALPQAPDMRTAAQVREGAHLFTPVNQRNWQYADKADPPAQNGERERIGVITR
jgi:hypothetical protein